MLEFVEIEGIRNLSKTSIELSPFATAIFGLNGSGKTSVLESIHILALGKSFRTNHTRTVIQHGKDVCRVIGRLQLNGRPAIQGVERTRTGDFRARIDGRPVSSFSRLAQQLPLVTIDAGGFSVLLGPPEGRRRFLDGILFHIEQSFLGIWQQYGQALRQRNAGLRHGILTSDAAWRLQLATLGERLSTARANLVSEIQSRLTCLVPNVSPDLEDIELNFRSGWDRSLSLLEALDRACQTDQAQGFTQVGAHRADLRLTQAGNAVSEVLSRGQMKSLLVVLRLVQGEMIEERASVKPLYLIDDLAAELDARHCENVCNLLGKSDRTVVLTAADRKAVELAWGSFPIDMFHVEHGNLRRC